jgi:hypothetical protein
MTFKARGATCVVEQLWPGISVDVAFAQLGHITRAASALPPATRPRVLGATLIPEDETLFMWCVAPSIDSVRSLLVASGVRFDRVLQVVHAKPQRALSTSGRSSP